MGRGRRSQGKSGPRHRPTWAVCEVCGKSQEHYLEVHLGGERHIFDSFECAISGLMPKCTLCGCLLLGAGVQVGDRLYCCYACASLTNVVEVELNSGAFRRANR